MIERPPFHYKITGQLGLGGMGEVSSALEALER